MENGVMLQGFEWHLPSDGSYYRNMREKAFDLKEAGFTSIWIPPVFKGMGIHDVGYGIYDMYDLGEFDQNGTIRTKYGLKSELLAMIEEFHKYKLDVYADIVMNHKAAGDSQEVFLAIEVDEYDRNKEIGSPKEIRAWTAFNFPGRNNCYSDFKWNFNHFIGVDYDDISGKNGIYRIIGENKGWNLGVSIEKGNYDYLMFSGIDHAHPDVKNEFIRWAQWFIKETKIDGFRIDAAKHIDSEFLREFVEKVREFSKDNFYILGEYWTQNMNWIKDFFNATSFGIELFDVPLHFNLHKASVEGDTFDLRTVFDNTIISEYPAKTVTFVDNHDSQPGQSLQSWVEPWFKEIAYALILLRSKGYPCVFYGDYYGIEGEYPYSGIKDKIDKLIELRQKYCFGGEDDYFQDSNLIGWVRKGTEENPVKAAVLVSNKQGGNIRMYLGEEYKDKEFIDKLSEEKTSVMIQKDGFGEFYISKVGVSFWVAK